MLHLLVASLRRGILVSLLMVPVSLAAWAEVATAFDSLLSEAGMRFERPKGFVEVEAPSVGVFPFDLALRQESGGLEVRYAIRPIARMKIDYQDPHGAAPEPDHVFPLIFSALVGVLSSGGHSPSREYPAEQARARFNSDWAAATAFDVDPAVSSRYRHGVLVAIHKSKMADAYVMFLYNDPEQAKHEIDRLLDHLEFLPNNGNP